MPLLSLPTHTLHQDRPEYRPIYFPDRPQLANPCRLYCWATRENLVSLPGLRAICFSGAVGGHSADREPHGRRGGRGGGDLGG